MGPASSESISLELRRYLTILRQRVVLIALTIAVAVAFTVTTADRTKTYAAQSTLYVGANSFSVDDTTPGARISGDQLSGIAQLMNTFATMIKSIPVAEDAVNLTGVPRSAAAVVSHTLAVPVEGTNLLSIVVFDVEPGVAQALATGVAEAFVAKLGQLDPRKPTEGAIPNAPVRIFDRAHLPTVPIGGAPTSNVITAALFGFLVSTGLVLLVEYLDITLKSRDDAERRLELPVIGIVPVLPLDPSTTRQRTQSFKREDLGLVVDA
jgi:capsular polysaccharide biosynthesis protein